MTIRVLVADDHGVVAEGLRALIDGQHDMKVVAVANNGADAVRRCVEKKPHVVVMDQAMPGLNGTEAAQMIRERRIATRVVMLSMHSNSVHVERALQAGASGYVLKQSVGGDLIEAIRAVHAGRRYLSKPLGDALIERMVAGPPEDPLSRLSVRERQILQRMAEGSSIVQIAAALSLSRKTVETYRERTMEKLGLENLAALVKFAVRHGMVPLE